MTSYLEKTPLYNTRGPRTSLCLLLIKTTGIVLTATEMLAITAAILLVFYFTCPQRAFAKQHMVGGSEGWDVSTDLSSWASSQSFKVGDQLVFKYTVGFHSVVELGSQKSYDQCDVNDSLNSMNDGKSVVKLEKPGYRYFACGTAGHCNEGMKVKIKVSTSGATNESSASDSEALSNTSPGVSPSCVSSIFIVVALSLAALMANF